jgi:SAM-dependent methyltransferase
MSSGSARATVILYSATMGLSAALVFLVQPMFARFILPLAGGTPAVWATAMVFFTTALLLGYLYAHWSTQRLGARRQAIVHIVLAAVPLAMLPIGLPDADPPTESSPVWWVIGVLAVSVGLPFFVVSTTAPLLQRWITATDHPDAADPYFLYRTSNAGSLLGLLAYPFLMEPALALGEQADLWSIGYAAFLVLLVGSAVALWRAPRPVVATTVDEAAPAPTWLQRARWIGIAFIPSSLMLGVTSFVSVDLAPIPLLWVAPLALYLLSFVIAFSPGARSTAFVEAAGYSLPFGVVGLAIVIGFGDRSPLWWIIGLHLGAFFLAAVVCHGRLAAERPHASHLTGFYACLAFGGALGAVFNALIAPNVFDWLTEYPVALVLACLVIPAWKLPRNLEIRAGGFTLEVGGGERADDRPVRQVDLTIPLLIGGVVAVIAYTSGAGDGLRLAAAAACLLLVTRPLRFGLGVGAALLALALPGLTNSDTIYRDRSFFGTREVESSLGGTVRSLLNGTTLHGTQIFTDELRRTPLTYYHPTGPLGQLLDGLPDRDTARRAAMVGLGTGSSACLERRRDHWTFFEIDPAVVSLARDSGLFTYLRECPGRRDIVLGDARLTLERQRQGEFGLIALDAFNSDAIPVHLLTREAVQSYIRRLAPNGTLAFHVSNRYVDLEPVLGNIGAELRLACRSQADTNVTAETPGKTSSHWVVLARQGSHLGRAATDRRWQGCDRDDARVWTDDYSNVLDLLT